jgi:hypothetical protein
MLRFSLFFAIDAALALALVAPQKKTFRRLAGGAVAWAAAVAGAECIHFHNHAAEWMCRVYPFPQPCSRMDVQSVSLSTTMQQNGREKVYPFPQLAVPL